MDYDFSSWMTFFGKMASIASGRPSEALEQAFSTTNRDCYIPPGPYNLALGGRYVSCNLRDPRVIHQNIAVAIDGYRRINCGEPFLHAKWLAIVEPRVGEIITQIGAGTGYYTSILASMVGHNGRIHAYEIDKGLGTSLAKALSSNEIVIPHIASGITQVIPESDVIYVNAAFPFIPASWLSALREDGRMIMPWKATKQSNKVLIISRSHGLFSAKIAGSVRFIDGVADNVAESYFIRDIGTNFSDIHSIWITSQRKPDSSAIAIFGSTWLSKDEIH